MAIHFFQENISFSLKNKSKHKNWIKSSIENEKFLVGDLNFIFTDNPTILSINNTYLKHNYFTDVITFDYTENLVISGDVYISIDTIKENSLLYNSIFDEELRRVLIHGTLHLLKFDDISEEDKMQMREKENFYLSRYQ